MDNLDELLKLLDEKLAEKESSLPQNKKIDSVRRFVEKKSIRKGLDKVPNYVIYFTYIKKYKATIGEEKWSKIHFFRVFNKYFEQTRVGKQRYYLLDSNSFDMSREGKIEAKDFDQKYKKRISLKKGI